MFNRGVFNIASLRDKHFFKSAADYARARQKTGMRENWLIRVIKVKSGIFIRQFQVGLIERADSTNIPPVAFVVIAIHRSSLSNQVGDNVAAKIIKALHAALPKHIHKQLGIE